jgi:hypothetical protein
MSNIWGQFTSKFSDLNIGNKSLSAHPAKSQQVFVCWVLTILNGYGDHLNHILNNPEKLQLAMAAWADGFRNYTPKHVVNTLHTFCDGKAHISNRFECNMPRNIAEFVYEMKNNQHQSATYATPVGDLLDFDKDTHRKRAEKGNDAFMRDAMGKLPVLKGLMAKRGRHIDEIEAEGGERLALHKRRVEGYDGQFRKHRRIVSEIY